MQNSKQNKTTKTLTEVINSFKGILEEDSIERLKEFKEHLAVQDDYSISKEDLLYLLDKKRKLKENSKSKLSSGLFFVVLFEYAMKGIPKDKKDKIELFSKKFFSYCVGNLSEEEYNKLGKEIIADGLPDLEEASKRCWKVADMLKEYVSGYGNKPLGWVAHYTNNNLVIILNNIDILKLEAGLLKKEK